ncbi:hypothetical protein SADO_13238 [Salinisphaera dokdonensis CL-ES53]|uniref:Tetratricopeptide repeat protein n=1 Tax=Salinisphaera dokdonensis CL-ES53 TaxID=1304272 RepID=A0ABV2B2Y8_9GAMM
MASPAYRPDSDATVLERLPASAELQQLQPLRDAVETFPNRLAPALELARAYIELSRQRADPRYLGYAEATLEPWSTGASPPIKVLRATIAQSRHEFEDALVLLNQVLDRDPGNAQARITRATIRQVQGRIADAASDCQQLAGHTAVLVVVICHSNARSLKGDLDGAYDELSRTLKSTPGVPATLRVWALTSLGEMAVRQGRDEIARAHYEDALKIAPDDIYLQAAYADLLLRHGEKARVIQLLREREGQDVLLLRLALAGAGTEDGRRWATTLADRFDAAARRGDTTHAREQARFTLVIEQEPERALALARANWDVQKEPADIEVLLRSAQAAGQPDAAEPALAWLSTHSYQDQRIRALISDLQSTSQ